MYECSKLNPPNSHSSTGIPWALYYSFDSSSVTGSSLASTGYTTSLNSASLANGASISTSDAVVGSGSLQLAASSSQYVQLPTFTIGSSGLTFACWFRTPGSTNYARIFDFGNGPGSDNIILNIQGNKLYVGGSGVYSSTGVSVNDNVWRHVAWTLDTNNNWIVYVNGASVWSASGQSYPSAISRSSNYIGKSNWGTDPYFDGAVDDFRVYNAVLTLSDVSNLYVVRPSTLLTFDANSVSGTSVTNSGSLSSSSATLVNGASVSASSVVVGSAAVQLSAASSQYVQLPTFTTGSNGLTFSCWFRSSGSETYARIFDFGNAVASDNIFMDVDVDTLHVTVFIGSSRVTVTAGTGVSVNDNVWRHVAWTLDVSGNWIIYINGVNVWNAPGQGYPSAISRSKNYLGRSNWVVDPYFTGSIDDFRVYNKLLTPSDVSNLFYCRSSSSVCPTGGYCPAGSASPVLCSPGLVCIANSTTYSCPNQEQSCRILLSDYRLDCESFLSSRYDLV